MKYVVWEWCGEETGYPQCPSILDGVATDARQQLGGGVKCHMRTVMTMLRIMMPHEATEEEEEIVFHLSTGNVLSGQSTEQPNTNQQDYASQHPLQRRNLEQWILRMVGWQNLNIYILNQNY